MPDAGESETVSILLDADASDAERLERLLPLVYPQLRAAAERALGEERPDHTLQATALVHEAYLRLVGPRRVPWANRAHFYAAAAEAMRRVLLDHAKSRGRQKRGSGTAPARLDDVADLARADSRTILALDDALRRLEDVEPEAASVTRFRFYAGLSVAQTAEAMGVSPRQVNRLWAYARAWLFRSLESESDDAPASGGHPG